VKTAQQLRDFLSATLPDQLEQSADPALQHIGTRDEFIDEATTALGNVPMAIRLTPYILSRMNWNNPMDDPIRRQFVPLRSSLLPDIEQSKPDSLHEEADSLVSGLVHRYPDRALFLSKY